MIIAYIGSEENIFITTEYADKHGATLERFSGIDINKIYYTVAQKTYNHIVVNVDDLQNNPEEIAEALKYFLDNTSANVIAVAKNYVPGCEMLKHLFAVGVTNIVTAVNQGQERIEMEAAFEGKKVNEIINNENVSNTPSPREKRIAADAFFSKFEKKPQNKETVVNNTNISEHFNEPIILKKNTSQNQIEDFITRTTSTKGKKIAFCGSINRIGTTTQALQAVRFLMSKNKKVAYIEINSSGYINDICDIEDIKKENDKISYNGIEMFVENRNIDRIFKMDYDYFVLDYGSVTQSDFNLTSFLQSDIKILLLGGTATEFKYGTNALRIFMESELFYIFSFCPETKHDEIRDMMKYLESRTEFAGYVPDMFNYSTNSDIIYNKIFSNESTNKSNNKKKGKFSSFFSKR